MNSRSALDLLPENPAQTTLARLWLTLGVASLIASIFYSILLVLSRTPAVQDIFPLEAFHLVSSVMYVDLSVLVWILVFEALVWSFLDNGVYLPIAKVSYGFCVVGTIILALSPLMGTGQVLMSNFIPVLDNQAFFIGLLLFGVGVFIQLLRVLVFSTMARSKSAMGYTLRITALMVILSMAALLTSYQDLPTSIEGLSYFDKLFWAGGHILQFVHGIILLLVWVWLASATGCFVDITASRLKVYFAIAIFPVLLSLPIFLMYEVISPEFRSEFAQLMKYAGLAALPLIAIIIISVLTTERDETSNRPARNALFASIIIFIVGGVSGFMLEAVNDFVAAHYFASIAAITLAFMGLTYHLLPNLGFNEPHFRTARLQPWIYGLGQMMHTMGLAGSSIYAVEHEAVDEAQEVCHLPEIISNALIDSGDLISIIGSLLFVVLVIKAMWPDRKES